MPVHKEEGSDVIGATVRLYETGCHHLSSAMIAKSSHTHGMSGSPNTGKVQPYLLGKRRTWSKEGLCYDANNASRTACLICGVPRCVTRPLEILSSALDDTECCLVQHTFAVLRGGNNCTPVTVPYVEVPSNEHHKRSIAFFCSYKSKWQQRHDCVEVYVCCLPVWGHTGADKASTINEG